MSKKSEMHRLNVALDEADEKLDELANRVDATRKLLDTLYDVSEIQDARAETDSASGELDALNQYVIDLMSDVFVFAAATTHGMPLKGKLAELVASSVNEDLQYMVWRKPRRISGFTLAGALFFGFALGFAGLLLLMRVCAPYFRHVMTLAEKLP